MPSPFPGMNPYLEKSNDWRGHQLGFLVRLQSEINSLVGPRLVCSFEADGEGDRIDRIPRRWLEIRPPRGEEVVTVVEWLCPWDKGPGRVRYLRNRQRVLRSPAHLVEIDLLRGGRRLPGLESSVCEYCVVISRAAEPRRADVRPLSLRHTLPTLPIPLRTGEPDLLLPLKPVLDQVYDGGGLHYEAYSREPHPPLSAEDAAWARQFVSHPGVA